MSAIISLTQQQKAALADSTAWLEYLFELTNGAEKRYRQSQHANNEEYDSDQQGNQHHTACKCRSLVCISQSYLWL